MEVQTGREVCKEEKGVEGKEVIKGKKESYIMQQQGRKGDYRKKKGRKGGLKGTEEGKGAAEEGLNESFKRKGGYKMKEGREVVKGRKFARRKKGAPQVEKIQGKARAHLTHVKAWVKACM